MIITRKTFYFILKSPKGTLFHTFSHIYDHAYLCQLFLRVLETQQFQIMVNVRYKQCFVMQTFHMSLTMIKNKSLTLSSEEDGGGAVGGRADTV